MRKTSAAVSTGIAANTDQLHFLTLQDGLLTVQADTTVNLTGERRAHFIYDIAARTAQEIFDE